jgi:hypothetical protein
MNKTVVSMLWRVSVIALCCCLPVAAQGRRTRKKSSPPAPPKEYIAESSGPDLGAVAGSVYTNDYFGIRLPIPEGWRVADEDGTRQINETGAKLMAGDSAEKRARLEAAAQKTLNLLTIGKPVSTDTGIESAILIVAAEPVPVWLIKSPQEYLGHAKRLLQNSAMKMNVGEEIRTRTIGGAEFAYFEVESQQVSGLVRQKYYATLKKGYALLFISTYASDTSLQAIEEVLKSTKIK